MHRRPPSVAAAVIPSPLSTVVQTFPYSKLSVQPIFGRNRTHPMAEIFTLEAFSALLALTFMEILLGIDNVIFVSIIMNRLPKSEERKASIWWISMGTFMRVLLLFSIGFIIKNGENLFHIGDHQVDLKDLIMAGGGLFLLVSTTKEIHNKVEGNQGAGDNVNTKKSSFMSIVIQIVMIDLIFSIDGVITAIGMTAHLELQIIAMAIAMIIMFVFAPRISTFIQKHPTFKMLALSFLILIAVLLLVEGVHVEQIHFPKGYVYFAMAFSFGVEILNMMMRKNNRHLHPH
jgi:predicted tellurium resistance membrane protein TerC